MSTHPSPRPTHDQASGEHVLFAMAAAFGVVLVAILFGAFMPLAVGIGVIFAVLAVVLALVGVFLARLLDDD